MAEEFPLPSSSYKELIKIIRAYGRIATEATLADVAKLAVMAETTVSGNNKFLIALGIIKSGQKKTITPLGVEFRVRFCSLFLHRSYHRSRTESATGNLVATWEMFPNDNCTRDENWRRLDIRSRPVAFH